MHRTGLDLLRGGAAYMVLAGHLAPAWVAAFDQGVLPLAGFPAFIGVELFFALSGFLIGGILLEMEATPRNVGIFLVRRWMRTLPVYYLALLVYLALPATFSARPPTEPWRYFVFLQNLGAHPAFFGVSWSLAIEEWFYLLLPLCLLARLRYLHAVVLLIVAGIALRFSLQVDYRSSVLGRIDAIAYGCLVAWAMRQSWSEPIARHARSIALGGVLGMVLLFEYFWTRRADLSATEGRLIYTLLPACAALLIPYFAAVELRSRAWLACASFGAAVSYPLYVWHNEIIHALSRSAALHPGTGLAHVVVVVVLASAVAYATHLLVERPIMRLRPQLDGARGRSRTATPFGWGF